MFWLGLPAVERAGTNRADARPRFSEETGARTDDEGLETLAAGSLVTEKTSIV